MQSENINVKIKKLHIDAVIPTYSKPGDAGLGITAVDVEIEGDLIVYKTGIAIAIPKGYVGLIFPRSSICKKDMYLTNGVGVIDSEYTGEIMFKYKTSKTNLDELKDTDNLYKIGDRIGQLIIIKYPEVNFIEVDELDSTERGSGGFGSTGE